MLELSLFEQVTICFATSDRNSVVCLFCALVVNVFHSEPTLKFGCSNYENALFISDASVPFEIFCAAIVACLRTRNTSGRSGLSGTNSACLSSGYTRLRYVVRDGCFYLIFAQFHVSLYFHVCLHSVLVNMFVQWAINHGRTDTATRLLRNPQFCYERFLPWINKG